MEKVFKITKHQSTEYTFEGYDGDILLCLIDEAGLSDDEGIISPCTISIKIEATQ